MDNPCGLSIMKGFSGGVIQGGVGVGGYYLKGEVRGPYTTVETST